MNRRSFFTKLGLAAATVAVLPSATTYARRWVQHGILLVPGAWYNGNHPCIAEFQYIGYHTFLYTGGLNIQFISKDKPLFIPDRTHKILCLS